MNRINTNKRAGKLAIFLFFTFLSLTTIAQNKDKKITIQNKNISLKEAFAQIETQTGYSIAYEQSNLNIEKKHSLSFKNVTIDKAMAQLLKETGYVYKIKGYHIIISLQDNRQKPANNDTQKLTQTIRGIVVDSKTNTPIEYASVCIAEDPSREVRLTDGEISGLIMSRWVVIIFRHLLWGIAQVSSAKYLSLHPKKYL